MKIKHIVLILIILSFTACEAFFTNSPLGMFKRDPASLSEGAQLALADDAVASGDTDTMNEIISVIDDDVLAGTASTEINEAAIDLVVSSSGLTDVVTDVSNLATSETTPTQAEVDDMIAQILPNIDISNVDTAEAAIDNLIASGETVTAEDYLFVAAAMAVDVATGGDTSTGTYDLTPFDPAATTPEAQNVMDFVTDAITDLTAQGVDATMLESLEASLLGS